MTAEDLELQVEQVRAKQRRPRAKAPAAAQPPLVDAATRAAHDYEPGDLEPAPPPTPPSSPDIPAHLRQYLVKAPPPGDSRLERSHRQLAGTLEAPVVIGNAHGWLGCDWAGLYRMADARRRAGLPTDDLDAEALKRGDELPINDTCPPPATMPPPSSS